MLPENLPSDPTSLVSRRDCALWSAFLFGVCFATGLCIEAPVISAFSTHPGLDWRQSLAPLFTALYVGFFPAAGIGAGVGFELHRLAVGSRPPNPMKWYTWLVVFLTTGSGVVMAYMQMHRRKNLILERHKLTLVAPFIYAAAGTVIFAISMFSRSVMSFETQLYFSSLNMAVFTLCAADCIAVNAVARCMRAGRLAPPESHSIQFSLATLFYGMLALGAYATGLVTLLR